MLRIISLSDLAEEITVLHKTGLPSGYSTGWPSIDELYTVAPGFWTVITGIPSHGKSTWMDCLMLNLIKQGWKFIVYSPENQPHGLYAANLIEKYLQRPFRKGYNNHLEPADIAAAISELDERLKILAFDDGAIFPCLETVMFTAEEIINGEWEGEEKIGVIIDPINELDNTPIAGMNETQYCNFQLMRFRQWVRRYGKRLHAWIVTHPAKPQRGRYGEFKDISLYDISGSSAWKNKADFGIIVRRREDCTAIDVEKCRWRHLGKQGQAYLIYEPGTCTFREQITRENMYERQGNPF